MANRSDFLGHLPRSVRKLIALGQAKGYITSDSHAADVRKAFVSAHRTYKAFKLNRKAQEPVVSSKREVATEETAA